MAAKKEIKTIEDLQTETPLNLARLHSEDNLDLIASSLKEVGAARSIVIDEAGSILAGKGTTLAAARAGIRKVRVIDAAGDELIAVRRTGLSKAKKIRLALFDNRASETSEWDTGELQALAEEGLLEGIFEDLPIDEESGLSMGKDLDDGEDVSEEEAAKANKKWKVRPGDLWQIGDHRLLCGDSTDAAAVERLMEGRLADLVLTDPPYGQDQKGILNDDEAGHAQLMRGAIDQLPIKNGVIIAFQSPRLFINWYRPMEARGYAFERMLWLYKAAQCTFPWRGWILKSEAILVFSKGKPAWVEVHPFAHDCYYLPEVSGELPEGLGWHGSVKPLKVVMDLMSRTSKRGAVVYEPFAGSGTTIVAAEHMSRKAYGIELSPDYCGVILERMKTSFEGIRIERLK